MVYPGRGGSWSEDAVGGQGTGDAAERVRPRLPSLTMHAGERAVGTQERCGKRLWP